MISETPQYSTSIIQCPPPHLTVDTFCQWSVQKGLGLEKRVMSNLGMHKWWLLRDYSAGKNTPEVYAMFIEVGVDRPALSVNNTVIVGWSPKPFSWGIWERLTRKFKKSDYPRKGDTLQVVNTGTGSFSLKQMQPLGCPSLHSRSLWQIMVDKGWVLIAQNETYSSALK